MAMYTSGTAIACRAGNGVVAKVAIHFNRVIFGTSDGPMAGERLQDNGDPYRLIGGADGSWGDWIPLLSWDNVSHPYAIDRLVVDEVKHADMLLVHFSIGDPPPEHGSETETIVTGLGDCPVSTALIDEGVSLYARVREIGPGMAPLVWDDETMWLKAEEAGAKAKPLKLPYADVYMVLCTLPPKDL